MLRSAGSESLNLAALWRHRLADLDGWVRLLTTAVPPASRRADRPADR